MAYTQLRDANWKVPYVGGWCLKYVQDAFGTDHPYASAIDAWNANFGGGNHPGELPPQGRTVPVYFSLGDVTAGHVADSLNDGTVASSTQGGSHAQGFIHPNLQNLIDTYAKYNGGCTYLGWSEYVGTVQVVNQNQVITQAPQGGGNVAEKANEDTARILAHGILARNGLAGRADALSGALEADLASNHVGQDLTNAYVQSLFLSDEGRNWRDVDNDQSIPGINRRLIGSDTKDATIATLTNNVAAEAIELTAAIKSLTESQAKATQLAAQIAAIKISCTPKPEPKHDTGFSAFVKYLIDLFKVKGAK
jgi:hypothetical protein